MAKKKKDAGRKSTAAAAAERMVMGGMPQEEQDDELMQSPVRMVVASFLRDKIAMIGLCAFIIIFLCCMILPFFFPIQMNYQDVTQANVAPGFGMLNIPAGLKDNAQDIAAGSTFSVGIDKDGNVYEWGTFPTDKLKKHPFQRRDGQTDHDLGRPGPCGGRQREQPDLYLGQRPHGSDQHPGGAEGRHLAHQADLGRVPVLAGPDRERPASTTGAAPTC